MENKSELFEKLKSAAIRSGAKAAQVIPVLQIKTDRIFRDICKSNSCGGYGRCYMCPPDVGEIDALIEELGRYSHVLVYQTVTEIEDSYDYEGMVEAKKATIPLAFAMRKAAKELSLTDALHLGSGGCGVCEVCAKRTGEPCRAPELALPSLEAYGVNVNELAKSAGMKYVNGQNTVTYFGAVLFNVQED